MTTGRRVQVSAPGRICLFGEHQDFLGLPVIACAVDLTIEISGTPRPDGVFRVDMPDVGRTEELDGAGLLQYAHKRDYLRAAVNVLRRHGLVIERGYDCVVHGTIPINAGTASSSALVVAWVTFLLATQRGLNRWHGDLPVPREAIARYAYEAEVLEFGEPGGMMDHYTSALGGLVHISFADTAVVEPLAARLEGLVLGDTLVPKETTETLRESRQAATAGVEQLAREIVGFDPHATALGRVDPWLRQMPDGIGRRVRAQLVNRDLCREAYGLLSRPECEQVTLGQLLLAHQEQLREGLGVSHPRLDELIRAGMAAGAVGGKLNGSGCGGAMFVWAPGRQREAASAIEAAGGRAYPCAVRGGVTVEIE